MKKSTACIIVFYAHFNGIYEKKKKKNRKRKKIAAYIVPLTSVLAVMYESNDRFVPLDSSNPWTVSLFIGLGCFIKTCSVPV